MEEERIEISNAAAPEQKTQADPALAAVAEMVQAAYGRALHAPELEQLHGSYNKLGCSGDVLMLLIDRCVKDLRFRYGEGRYPTMWAVEAEAMRWRENGILTVEKAKAYLEPLERRDKLLVWMRKLLNDPSWWPAPKERNFIAQWADINFPKETLELAYTRTMSGAGRMVFPYMDRILKDWQENGLRTVADIEGSYSRRPTRKPSDRPLDEPPVVKSVERLVEKKILAPNEVENYLSSFYEQESQYDRLWVMLGSPGNPDDTQKEFLANWTAMNLPDDVFALAYDRIVTYAGHLVWEFMDAILRAWYGTGLRTVSDIVDWELQYWTGKGNGPDE